MPTENRSTSPSRNPFAPMLWAVFLGVSWTWVIGMFLPVLLVRDYGLWGWVVFAVPNVVGAAAMGWALRDAQASEQFARRHAGACYAFSVVTIGYHLFFAAWIIQRLKGWGLAALGIYAAIALLPVRNTLRWIGAIAVLGVSLVAWVLLQSQGQLVLPSVLPAVPPGGGGAGGGLGPALLLLLPFVLGFGLCPYLDLTFHRARQSTSPAGGRLAFGVGFGVVFFSMIVFTLLYARCLAPAVNGTELDMLTTLLLCVHLIGQSAFTVAAHVRELPGVVFDRPGTARLARAATVVFLVGLPLAGWLVSRPRPFLGHDLGECVYWSLLGFYGLVFPGYLWLQGVPGRNPRGGVSGRTLAVLAGVVGVAFPMYWMGFVERRPIWLVPGVAVVLAGRLLTRDRPGSGHQLGVVIATSPAL